MYQQLLLLLHDNDRISPFLGSLTECVTHDILSNALSNPF